MVTFDAEKYLQGRSVFAKLVASFKSVYDSQPPPVILLTHPPACFVDLPLNPASPHPHPPISPPATAATTWSCWA